MCAERLFSASIYLKICCQKIAVVLIMLPKNIVLCNVCCRNGSDSKSIRGGVPSEGGSTTSFSAEELLKDYMKKVTIL